MGNRPSWVKWVYLAFVALWVAQALFCAVLAFLCKGIFIALLLAMAAWALVKAYENWMEYRNAH